MACCVLGGLKAANKELTEKEYFEVILVTAQAAAKWIGF